MANFCRNCGKPLKPQWEYCVSCGMNLTTFQVGHAKQSIPPLYKPISGFVDVNERILKEPKKERKKRLTKRQTKAIVIISIVSAASVVTGLAVFFGLYQVRTINFFVNNGGTRASHTPVIPRSDYKYYQGLAHPSHSFFDNDLVAEAVESYCTPNEPHIRNLALEIKAKCGNPNDNEEVINALLSFTQAIDYKSESTDRATYPLETLYDKGDCEDMAIFFGSLVEAVGFNAILILVEVWDDDEFDWIGHVCVGVYLSFVPTHHSHYPPSYSYDVGGDDYWICETTAQGWRIGDIPVLNPGDFRILTQIAIN